MKYFSEKEEGERPLVNEEIGTGAWGGIKTAVIRHIENGAFGATYPLSCDDGRGPIGADAEAFWEAMQAEIPGFQDRQLPPWFRGEEQPRVLDILDMIEFCWRCIGKPIQTSYHSHFQHHHLRFDVEAGRSEFGAEINQIFRPNGIVYALNAGGSIERTAPPVLREALASTNFRTRDPDLNRMLEAARVKFLDPDEEVRREALEKLWDAWERLKTLGPGADKPAQITALLDTTAGAASPVFRQKLENGAKELTKIGNDLQIRHTEVGKERVGMSEHIDYLFHRLFSLIRVILRANSAV